MLLSPNHNDKGQENFLSLSEMEDKTNNQKPKLCATMNQIKLDL